MSGGHGDSPQGLRLSHGHTERFSLGVDSPWHPWLSSTCQHNDGAPNRHSDSGLTRKTASARLSTANGAQALGNTLRTKQRASLDSAKTAGMPELE